MAHSSNASELCRYHYDALDRQCGCKIAEQTALQRFHCQSRLATETQGVERWSFFQHDEQLLAQHNHLGANATTTLLATDHSRSVLIALDTARLNPLAYSPYGHRPAHSGLLSLLGFTGERPDLVTGHYHLGNGYRQFDPVLMRFNRPDSLSPFGKGGLNAYGYCAGDPVNQIDPSGHFKVNAFLETLQALALTHHTPRPFNSTTMKAVTKTVKILGGEDKVVELAAAKNMLPETLVINKTINIRMKKADATIKHMPPPLNTVQYRTAIDEVKKTQNMLVDFLTGSRKDGFRPEDLHTLNEKQLERLKTLASKHNELTAHTISIREV